jgi:hypothetical protein
MIVKENTAAKKFEIAPAGSHMGRLYSIIDLGTQKSEWEGKVNFLRKVKFFFELFGKDDNGKALVTSEGKPLIQTRNYTLSLGEKAALRIDLQSWRGKAFTQEELKGFNLKNLLGKFCMVNIIHTDRQGNTYADCKGLSPVPNALRELGEPTPVNAIRYFSLDEYDPLIFAGLSEGLQKTINESAEMRNAQTSAVKEIKRTQEPLVDDIPF